MPPARMSDEYVAHHNAVIDKERAERRQARIEIKSRLFDAMLFIAVGYGLARVLIHVF
jgi:hypothetical protein